MLWGLGFMVYGSRFRVYGVGLRVEDLHRSIEGRLDGSVNHHAGARDGGGRNAGSGGAGCSTAGATVSKKQGGVVGRLLQA
jgi:hypothetical protein